MIMIFFFLMRGLFLDKIFITILRYKDILPGGRPNPKPLAELLVMCDGGNI